MKRYLIMLLVVLAHTLNAAAQNKIDQLVEQFSATAECTFTSVVKRNPATRQVEMVVKTLTMEGNNAKKMRSTFLEEGEKHSLIQKKDGDKTVYTFAAKAAKANRIYTLHIDRDPYYPRGKVMIIINIK